MRSKEDPIMATNDLPVIRISRQVYNAAAFDESFGLNHGIESPLTVKEHLKRYLRSTWNSCSSKSTIARKVMRLFPVIDHLKVYQWKKWISKDIMAALSGGVIHVPQGMGFALLAGLPPVYGLYTSFFPGLIYYIFGTSRHLSFGTMALTALMVGTVVHRELALVPRSPNSASSTKFPPTGPTTLTNQENASFDSFSPMNGTSSEVEDVVSRKVAIAVSVTLLAGLFQLLMRICRLGVLTLYMSMPFVGSFMAGSALQIMVSQLPFQLGVTITRPPDTFQLPLTLYEVFRNIAKANVCAVISSIISIAFLIGIKEGVNERFKMKFKIPVPVELMVVIIATIISHFCQLSRRFGLAVIGAIPAGMPAPRIPPMTNATNYIGDAVAMAIIGFALAVTMAQLMSIRNQYEIDTNQEVLAYGIVNTISPFFNCFMATQAPPRTMVHEATGCKTQLAGLLSIILPLLVVLWIGPLFESLPTSVLGSIVTCSLVALMKQFADLPFLWQVNRFDFFVWITTFLTTSLLSVTIGLATGVGLNVFFVVLQGQLARGYQTVAAPNTEIYYRPSSDEEDGDKEAGKEDDNEPAKNRRTDDIAVFRFECGEICFVNADSFKRQLYRSTVDPNQIMIAKKQKIKKTTDKKGVTRASCFRRVSEVNVVDKYKLVDETSKDFNGSVTAETTPSDVMKNEQEISAENQRKTQFDIEEELSSGVMSQKPSGPKDRDDAEISNEPSSSFRMPLTAVRGIVLDLSCVCYVDITGLNFIKQISTDYRSAGIDLMLAGCCEELKRKFQVFGVTKTMSSAAAPERGGVMETSPENGVEVYVTVHDAVVASKQI